jgi:hypothetical protein
MAGMAASPQPDPRVSMQNGRQSLIPMFRRLKKDRGASLLHHDDCIEISRARLLKRLPGAKMSQNALDGMLLIALGLKITGLKKGGKCHLESTVTTRSSKLLFCLKKIV